MGILRAEIWLKTSHFPSQPVLKIFGGEVCFQWSIGEGEEKSEYPNKYNRTSSIFKDDIFLHFKGILAFESYMVILSFLLGCLGTLHKILHPVGSVHTDEIAAFDFGYEVENELSSAAIFFNVLEKLKFFVDEFSELDVFGFDLN